MNKLKWCLRLVTVCLVIFPLLFTFLAYSNNLPALILPPQIAAAMSGDENAIQSVLPDFENININDIAPVLNDFQFNEDGSFSLSFNVTSPLNSPITFNSLSLTVTDENGTILGTIELTNSVLLNPGGSSTVPINGVISQEFLALLQNNGIDPTDPNFNPENITGIDLNINGIKLTNVNIDIGGVIVHVDELNLNDLFGSQESGPP